MKIDFLLNQQIAINLIKDIKYSDIMYKKTENGIIFYVKNHRMGYLSICFGDDIKVYINLKTSMYGEDGCIFKYNFANYGDEVDDEYIILTTRWAKHLLYEATTTLYCPEHYPTSHPTNFKKNDKIANDILENSYTKTYIYDDLLLFKASYKNKVLLKQYLEYIGNDEYIRCKVHLYNSTPKDELNAFGL